MPEITWDDDENSAGFNSDEFGVEAGESESSGEAAELVQNLTAPASAGAGDISPDVMGDIDRRLKLASCYRVVLDGNLFEGQEDEDTALVQSEINGFVRQRLRALVGLEGGSGPSYVAAKPQFSEAETAAIKAAAELAQSSALQALARLGQREVVALQILAQAAMKQRGLVPEQKRPEQKAAPMPAPPKLAKKVPPAAPVKPAAPALRPLAMKPVTKPGGRKPADLKKKVVSRIGEVDPATGKPFETEVQRIQRPTGMVPFPSDHTAMAIATSQQAQSSVAIRSNIDDINTGINHT